MMAPERDYSTTEATLEALRLLYEDLPPALRNGNQGLATCALPLTIMDWTSDDFTVASHPFGNPPDLRAPALRRDFYTGEIFVERQSNFTLRARDLENVNGLRCVECENFTLNLEGLSILEQAATRHKFLLHFYACADFTIRQISATGGRNLALIEDCDRFIVSDVDCRDYEGYGLILLHSRFFRIQDCRFTRNLASGAMVLGDCRHGTITDCQFLEGRGYYNWDAGLHICHCSRRITAAQVPELSHEPLPIRNKTMRPSRIRVQRNLFKGNRAQGIYLEGARECLFLGNTLADNNKEGICFDWGTSLCVLRGNDIRGNGYRSNMTETELNIDFIQDFPLLPDQSSTCKLPGISFDNGVLNAVVDNRIQDNYGGGIKLVRSAIGNLIAGNSFFGNTKGQNFFVKRVYDVYILSLGNRGGEFDDHRTALLDFYASSFNSFQKNCFDSSESDALHHGREYNNFQANQFNPSPEAMEWLDGHGNYESSCGPPEREKRMRHTPPENPPPLSGYTLYAFGGVTQKHHAVIRLRPDGVIDFSSHPNESHWRIDGQQLLFFDSGFKITTRFHPFTNPTNQTIFVGQFLDSGILHYLIPLISTDGKSPSSVLPPLFINAMPHADASLVERFFAGLGWVHAGLHFGPIGTCQPILDGSGARRSIDDENPHFPFPKISSIIQPGQYLTGNVPWKDEYQPGSNGLFCIQCTTNLRNLLVSHCMDEERKAGSSGLVSGMWHHIKDPHDRFLAFLNLFSSEYRNFSTFSPWLDSDRALTIRIEDIAERSLSPTLRERLASFGIPESSIGTVFDRLAPADVPSLHRDGSNWKEYWSDRAERFFESSGLQTLNARLGYPS